MKWLIMTRKTSSFLDEFESFLAGRGEKVNFFFSDSIVDPGVLDHDVMVLKSRILPFIYGGFLAKVHGKIVMPDPMMAYRLRTRWESDILLRRAGINVPPAAFGYRDVLKDNLSRSFFPSIVKPLMGSRNIGIRLVEKTDDLNAYPPDHPIYLQKQVEGIHYKVNFIGETITMTEKEPMLHECRGKPLKNVPGTVRAVIDTYRNATGLLVGDLDIVIGDEIWAVDPGAFPSFNGIDGAGLAVAQLFFGKAKGGQK